MFLPPVLPVSCPCRSLQCGSLAWLSSVGASPSVRLNDNTISHGFRFLRLWVLSLGDSLTGFVITTLRDVGLRHLAWLARGARQEDCALGGLSFGARQVPGKMWGEMILCAHAGQWKTAGPLQPAGLWDGAPSPFDMGQRLGGLPPRGPFCLGIAFPGLTWSHTRGAGVHPSPRPREGRSEGP